MGNSKSNVRKLSPKTIADLQKNVDVDFSRDEIEEWFREYQSSLGKGMARLTMREFKQVYNSVFDGDASTFVGHLFRSFDADQDGFVDFKEFIVGLCVSGSDKPEAKLKWAFKMYDIDGNGSISREEMSSMLKLSADHSLKWELAAYNGHGYYAYVEAEGRVDYKAIYRMITTDLSSTKTDLKLIEELVQTFFESADRNHDNAISEEEFVEGVKDMPVILHLLQCDPEAGIDDVETIENFDSLHVSEEQMHSNIASTSTGSSSAKSKSYKTEPF